MQNIKLLLLFIATFLLYTISITLAQGGSNNPKDFNIIPAAKDQSFGTKVEELGDPKSGDFWQKYNELGTKYDESNPDKYGKNQGDVGASFATGIFTWDTILLFVANIARWIANVALVAGAACVIYAGYLYATSVFTGDNSGKANEAIKYAAIGITVITLSYGILRIAIAAFL